MYSEKLQKNRMDNDERYDIIDTIIKNYAFAEG